MAEFEAILFDFDGVLVDSEPLHFACWRDLVSGFGGRLEWEDYARLCVGVSERETVGILCRLAAPEAGIGFERLWALYPRKQEMFRERVLAAPPVGAGIGELLAALDGSYRMAVVSSSLRGEIEPVLDSTGLRPFFETVVCGGDVARHKPAPDPYLEAARRLGTRAALVVEDSAAGIASGRAAGFDVLEIGNAAQTARRVRERLGI